MINRIWTESCAIPFACVILLALTIVGCQSVEKSSAYPYDFPLETTALNDEVVVGIYKGKTKLLRNPVRMIAEGDFQGAIKTADKRINENGVYGHYFKALALAHRGDVSEAWNEVETSIEKGLSLETYMAGPKSLLVNLYNYDKFQRAIHDKQLIHGPMLGGVTDGAAKFWVRTWDEADFRVTLSERPDMSNPLQSSKGVTRRADDFTGTVEVSGLRPDTTYYYRLHINGISQPIEPLPYFRTYPVTGTPGRFEVAFGACSNLNPGPEREVMWDTVLKRRPLAFVQLGDNTYIDDPTSFEYQRSSYYRRHSAEPYRRLMAGTSNYAVWDDHDFSINDGMSSSDYDSPPWKKKVLEVFKQNFIAPYFGEKGNPGIYTDFSIGDVDFLLLDLRYYKDNPLTVDNPTHMGQKQKEWFLNKLKNSTAKFKVVFTAVPFGAYVSGKKEGRDTWDGYPQEKQQIYDFIKENNISGVIFATGDRHRADARVIHIDGNYDIPEFLNANLTNTRPIPLVKDAADSTFLFGYNERRRNHYGMLSFDTTKADPEVTYTIVNDTDEDKGSVTFKLSQLTNTPE